MIQMRQDLVYYVVQKLYSKTFLVVKFFVKNFWKISCKNYWINGKFQNYLLEYFLILWNLPWLTVNSLSKFCLIFLGKKSHSIQNHDYISLALSKHSFIKHLFKVSLQHLIFLNKRSSDFLKTLRCIWLKELPSFYKKIWKFRHREIP